MDNKTAVIFIKNGPVKIKGKHKLVLPDNKSNQIEYDTAICRCGKSGCLPKCDGSHNN
ncbi:MAG: CDGSH iron-sulfur domain-containing protein [Bacteroidales bacterium]|jgi:CDGSH-type Zn-finger protein|nr:CDGSH iron-sulfur domain-containing protein [Bacteroidales bacterium]